MCRDPCHLVCCLDRFYTVHDIMILDALQEWHKQHAPASLFPHWPGPLSLPLSESKKTQAQSHSYIQGAQLLSERKKEIKYNRKKWALKKVISYKGFHQGAIKGDRVTGSANPPSPTEKKILKKATWHLPYNKGQGLH